MILSRSQILLLHGQRMELFKVEFYKRYPLDRRGRKEQTNDRKHLVASDKKPDIDCFRLLVYIKNHAWDRRSQFWFTIDQGQNVFRVVPMLPVRIASHTSRVCR